MNNITSGVDLEKRNELDTLVQATASNRPDLPTSTGEQWVSHQGLPTQMQSVWCPPIGFCEQILLIDSLSPFLILINAIKTGASVFITFGGISSQINVHEKCHALFSKSSY